MGPEKELEVPLHHSKAQTSLECGCGPASYYPCCPCVGTMTFCPKVILWSLDIYTQDGISQAMEWGSCYILYPVWI